MPAIILGAGITALGVIRSLSKFDIPTYYVSDKRDFVSCSRWANSGLFKTSAFPTPEELSDCLYRLPFDRAVLFPCTDAYLNAVIGLNPELRKRFSASLPSEEALKILINKDRFSEILMKLEIPHPRTLMIEDSDQIENLSQEHLNNFFFKPTFSLTFSHKFHRKAFRIFGLDDALQKFKDIKDAEQSIVLQEFIPGPADQHYFIDGFVDRKGQIRAVFARRRKRMYPQYFGNSTYCISISLEDVREALESVYILLDFIKYRGIFSAEFKYDARDNKFKILEVNARPWWYIGFATQCEVNVCRMAYRDALNRPVEPVGRYREGMGCMFTFFDLMAVLVLMKENNLSVYSWLNEFFSSKKPVFSRDDPLPSLFSFFTRPYSFIKNKIN